MPLRPARLAGTALLAALLGTRAAAQPAPSASPNAAQAQLCYRANDARAADGRARAQAAARAGGAAGAFAEGCLALADDRYEQAQGAFERAVAADDRSAVYHFFLGQAYGAQAQRANVFKQASLARKTKAEFDRAVALDPDFVDAREGLMQYYLQAPGIMGGSQEKAREQAYEIRKRSPYRGALLYANLALRAKDQAGAVRELEGVTRQFPDSLAPYTSLAVLHTQQKNYAAAWAAVDRMAQRRADAPAALYAQGRLAAESGQQLDRGAAALTRYLQLPARGAGDPPPANAHYRLGSIYERQGKKAEARAEYEAALRLNAKLKEAGDALARVR